MKYKNDPACMTGIHGLQYVVTCNEKRKPSMQLYALTASTLAGDCTCLRANIIAAAMNISGGDDVSIQLGCLHT